jgi:hypothetical protein
MLWLTNRLQNFDKNHWPAKIILIWCFFTLFIFHPFSSSQEIAEIFKQGIFIIGGILSFFYIVLTSLFKPVRIASTYVICCFVLLVLLNLISLTFSINPVKGLIGNAFETTTLAVVFSFVLVVMATAVSFQSWSVNLSQIYINIIGTFLIIKIIIAEIFSGGQWLQNIYHSDTQLHILAASLLILASYRLVYFEFSDIQRKLLYIYIFSVFFLFLTSSVLAIILIVTLLFSLIFFIYSLIKFKKTRTAHPIFFWFMLSVSLFLATSHSYLSHTEINRQYQMDIILDFKALKNSFSNHYALQLVGPGTNNYYYFFQNFRSIESNQISNWNKYYNKPYIYDEPNHAFGFIPTLAINNGLIGIGFWLLIILSVIYWFFIINPKQSLLYNGHSQDNLLFLLLILFTLVLPVSIFTLALMAVCLGKMQTAFSGGFSLNLSGWWTPIKLIIFLGLCSLTVILIVGFYYVLSTGIIYAKSVNTWIEQNNPKTAEFNLAELITTRQKSEYYRLQAQINFFQAHALLKNKQTLSDDDKASISSLLKESIVKAQKAAEMDEGNFKNWLLLGEIQSFVSMFGASDLISDARNNFTKAHILSKNNPNAFIGLSRIELMVNNKEGALSLVEDALFRKSDYEEAILLKNDILKQ